MYKFLLFYWIFTSFKHSVWESVLDSESLETARLWLNDVLGSEMHELFFARAKPSPQMHLDVILEYTIFGGQF